MPAALEAEERPTLHLERCFDAPRALVWRAWSRPEILVLWMGPPDWPAAQVHCDFRVGGRWRIALRSPSTGEELWQGGEYREIRAPELLSFTFRWEGDNHEDGAPVETLVTVRLAEAPAGGTLMRFAQEGLKSAQSLAGHRHGWTGTADRLERWLAETMDGSPGTQDASEDRR